MSYNFLVFTDKKSIEKYRNDIAPTESLVNAINKDNYDLVKKMIDSGVDINMYYFPYAYKKYPIHDAAFSWDTRCLKLLLESGANVNVIYDRKSCLYYASSISLESVMLLFKYGARIDIETKEYESTLNQACDSARRDGNADILKFLLDNGADPNLQYKYGKSPLRHAVDNLRSAVSEWDTRFKGAYDAVELLMSRGASETISEYPWIYNIVECKDDPIKKNANIKRVKRSFQ